MNSKTTTRVYLPLVMTVITVMTLMMGAKAQAADNLRFTGDLVAEPCTLRPGDDAITVDITDVSIRELYSNTRTPGRAFQIHLEGCNSSIADSVTTTFSGAPNAALPGLLALDGSSVAHGVALGLETPADIPLPLNVTSDTQTLSDGNNIIEFKAYVRGEPQAIADRSIQAGAFRATSTFTLNYP